MTQTDPTLQEIEKIKEIALREIQNENLAQTGLESGRLKKQAAFLQKFISKAKEQFNVEIKNLTELRQVLRTQTAALTNKQQFAYGELTKLRKIIENIKQQITTTQTDLQAYRKEKLSDIDTEIGKRVSEIKLREGQTRARELSLNAFDSKLINLEKELQDKETGLDEKLEAVKVKNDKLNKIHDELKDIKEGIKNILKTTLEKQAKTNQLYIDTDLKNKRATDKLTKANDYLTDIDKQKTELTNLIDTKEKLLSQKDKELSEKDTRLKQKERWLIDREKAVRRAYIEMQKKE